jgi:signal transduction histidine kinase
MPYSDNQRETLDWVIRLHWFLVVGLLIVCFITEGAAPSQGLSSYDIVFSAALFFLIIYLFFVLRKGERFLAPLLFLVDGAAIAFGVAISGGPVSYYIPIFFISLVGTCLVCTPAWAITVIIEHFLLFGAALTFAYHPLWPNLVPVPAVDDMGYYLNTMPEEARNTVFVEQAIRWWFFMGFFCVMATLLVRRMWVREERLRVRERSLEQKRHLIQLGEMTGRIAHGVNTPLGLLSGNMEMLIQETRKGTKLHKRLLELDGFVQRAITTVRETLDYNRQSMSQIRPVSITDLLSTVAETVQTKLKQVQGELILDLEKKIPNIQGYPEGLFQALLNVVENAVDSLSPGGKGVVTISASFRFRSMRLSAADRRGEVVVAVRDTGSGIPAGELDRVFEPFYSTKDYGRGTGLGLSIVKRIVEEHQGTLQIESHVGMGTSVTLSFPAEWHEEAEPVSSASSRD